MSPPTPLWRLLAPIGSAKPETSEFLDNILSEKTYADPIRWTRFMWYAPFVQELHIIAFGTEDKHKQIIHALVEHNGGESIFPALQTLWWSPSSYSDSSYFPLFTPQLRSAILNFPHSSNASLRDPLDRSFLARLRVSSPRLDYLCVDASWGPLGVDHLTVIPSFEHLTDLNLVATTSLTWFRKLATMPRMKSLRIAYVASNKSELSRDPEQIHAPRLTAISVGGNCPSLAHLFTALGAPRLASASFHAMSDDRDRDPDYISCIKALATTCPPSTLEVLCIALDEDGGPQTLEYLTDLLDPFLPFRSITHLTLSCPMVGLVAQDHDLWAVADAWPKLRTLKLSQAYWEPCTDPTDPDSTGIPLPTADALASFHDHCPDLRELVLPPLSFNADVPAPRRRRAGESGPRHGLKTLAFGAKDLGGEDDDEEGWMERLGEQDPEPDHRQVVRWARYILDLFPKLDAEASGMACRSMSADSAWMEVFERIGDLRNS
ncbi:hypothetical protein GSI_12280 [Ganoderma sinense ZZ0214-1]|uniref:F-box domain-containing protein n=1 Tax=Ganoderma sinense ZZ0214-1 TaxID=1077348 RepID=A0A2G8RYD3_9APHY|nr:hypothetical protein GSI_12280 [Ganoderma sinense ZZ0214-1]